MRRTVTEKLGQHVDIARQRRGGAGTSSSRNDALLQKLDHVDAVATCRRTRLGVCGVRTKQMIDRSASGRLPTFVEPEAGHHARIIRSPNAGYETWLDRTRHDAGGRPDDVSQPIANIDGTSCLKATADGANSACVRIDQGCADRSSWVQAKFTRSRPGQSCADRRARRDDVGPDSPVVLVCELVEADPLKIWRAPALFVRQEIPFAGHGARRTRQ